MTLLKLLLLQKAAQMRSIFDGAEGDRPTQDAGSQSSNLYDEMLEMCIQACHLRYSGLESDWLPNCTESLY
jgi:hypothetical protein